MLRAFAGASGGTAVILRLRADGEHTWPLLEILGATEERVHVHAELDTGIVLDAWVERENLRPPPAVLSACGCDCLGSMGCGHGYGGESYRGAASLPAGTELSDGLGVVWGRLVVDAEVELVIARSASRGHAVGAPQPPVLETVWLERIPGLIADPCAGLGVHVPRAAVTLH